MIMAHGLDVHCSSVLHVEYNIIIIYHYNDDKKNKKSCNYYTVKDMLYVHNNTHTQNMPAGFYKLHPG